MGRSTTHGCASPTQPLRHSTPALGLILLGKEVTHTWSPGSAGPRRAHCGGGLGMDCNPQHLESKSLWPSVAPPPSPTPGPGTGQGGLAHLVLCIGSCERPSEHLPASAQALSHRSPRRRDASGHTGRCRQAERAVCICLCCFLLWLEQHCHIVHAGLLTPPQLPRGPWDGEPPGCLGVAPLLPK